MLEDSSLGGGFDFFFLMFLFISLLYICPSEVEFSLYVLVEL